MKWKFIRMVPVAAIPAGWWGVWMIAGGHEKELFGGDADTTNNRMELMAVIRGFEGPEATLQGGSAY